MATPVATGLTRDDLDDLPDDGRRYELLDGRLFVTPMARRRHQWVASQIIYRLKAFHRGAPRPRLRAGQRRPGG